MKKSTKELVLLAILMAMTVVFTMLVSIPVPATKGYVNLGDGILMISALLLGRKKGAVVGGIGSALADILLGYAYYAPITLIVKGLEGFIAGYCFEKFDRTKALLATGIAGVVMALGYLIAETFLYTFPTALVAFGPNILQGLVGAVLASILLPLIERALS